MSQMSKTSLFASFRPGNALIPPEARDISHSSSCCELPEILGQKVKHHSRGYFLTVHCQKSKHFITSHRETLWQCILTPKTRENARELWRDQERSVTDCWDQNFQWVVALHCYTTSYFLKVTVLQFRVDGLSVHLLVVMSRRRNIFGS
jgi:hypothetical protein